MRNIDIIITGFIKLQQGMIGLSFLIVFGIGSAKKDALKIPAEKILPLKCSSVSAILQQS